MSADNDHQPGPSQTSSHTHIEPVSGAILFEHEARRRDALLNSPQKGNCTTGCRELDQSVLIGGGFERGSVVGISAEDDEIGLVLGLQTIARLLLLDQQSKTKRRPPRVMIITTMVMGALMAPLKDVLRAEMAARAIKMDDDAFRTVLERISISRVFDVSGLWDVLTELEPNSSNTTSQEQASSSPLSEPPSSLPDIPPWETSTAADEAQSQLPEQTPPGQRPEIQDSEEEDEDGFSSPLSLPRQVQEEETTFTDTVPLPNKDDSTKSLASPQSQPDIILITHMSTLLSSLFHQREKASAHQVLQLLASHLRYVTRSADYGAPLVIVLNSTTSSDRDSASAPPPGDPSATVHHKVLDPTLRSIFTPQPLSGLGSTLKSRRNKPSFGLIFSQILDLHLLCTKVPKTRADAEALFAPNTTHDATAARQAVESAWVVEVLLDELGLWEGRESLLTGQPRTLREQRWGAVELRKDKSGLRIVDAFQKKQAKTDLLLAAGFGGRRV